MSKTSKPIKKTQKKAPLSTKKKLAKTSRLDAVSTWLRGRTRWQRIVIYVLVAVFSIYGVHRFVTFLTPEVKDPNYGVSFSVKYARELGVDWQANYTALLDDMQIRSFRLMSYWDDTEPQRGTFKFEDLDWQMNEAQKRGAKVSLAIGMRQPRWPECHKPKWLEPLTAEQRDEALFEFNKVVVQRYKDHPALESYQMENEAVNSWFGTCTPEDIDQKRLETEFAEIKKIDPDTPVYMSLSDQHGLPLGKPVPDKYGFSVYRIVWNAKTGPLKFYIKYPTPVWYHRLRALWINVFKDRDIFIHELQVEPWGPEATVNLSVEEQNRSMSPNQIRENLKFARKIGEKDIYTWGGEWWYWRKVNLNDPSIWNTVKDEFNR